MCDLFERWSFCIFWESKHYVFRFPMSTIGVGVCVFLVNMRKARATVGYAYVSPIHFSTIFFSVTTCYPDVHLSRLLGVADTGNNVCLD